MHGSANPFVFLALQDVQELSNFFERRVSAYQMAVSGSVSSMPTFDLIDPRQGAPLL